MKNKNERELKEKDRLEYIIYNQTIAQHLIQLAIRLQQKDIINHLGENIK